MDQKNDAPGIAEQMSAAGVVDENLYAAPSAEDAATQLEAEGALPKGARKMVILVPEAYGDAMVQTFLQIGQAAYMAALSGKMTITHPAMVKGENGQPVRAVAKSEVLLSTESQPQADKDAMLVLDLAATIHRANLRVMKANNPADKLTQCLAAKDIKGNIARDVKARHSGEVGGIILAKG